MNLSLVLSHIRSSKGPPHTSSASLPRPAQQNKDMSATTIDITFIVSILYGQFTTRLLYRIFIKLTHLNDSTMLEIFIYLKSISLQLYIVQPQGLYAGCVNSNVLSHIIIIIHRI